MYDPIKKKQKKSSDEKGTPLFLLTIDMISEYLRNLIDLYMHFVCFDSILYFSSQQSFSYGETCLPHLNKD